MEITAQVPGSSEPKTETVGEGTSQFLFLPQTRIELRLVADQPLESAEVSNGGAPVAGWQRVDDRTYTLSWTMTESMALEFRLVGERGRLTSKPYFLAIGLLKDREPRVTIRSSGVGRRITPVARIPLAVRATDDFGVVSFGLELERTQVRDDKPEVTGDRLDLAKDLAPSPEGPPAGSTPAAAPPRRRRAPIST